MFWSLLSLMILSFTAIADEERRLSLYVQSFQLKALTLPAKNLPLYDLGLRLFYDVTLSGKGNVGCFSCHSHSGFSGDTLPLALGEGAQGIANKRTQHQGLILLRHTPAIYNSALPDVPNLFWDGRVTKRSDGWQTPEPKLNGPNPELKEIAQTLSSVAAVQAIFPLASPEEMLGKESTLSAIEAWDLVMKKILKGPKKSVYLKLFKAAFPDTERFNIGHVGNALAHAELHHFSAVNTPWDHYLRGNKNIMTPRMKRGAILFLSKARCFECHKGDQFSSFGFQSIAVPQIGKDDKGRYEVTKNRQDLYKFRIPPLRNVGLTSPYMHSGIFKNLWEVIEHYADPIHSLRSFSWTPVDFRYHDSVNLDTYAVNLDNREQQISSKLPRKLSLETEEKRDLYCFLKVALTDISLQKKLKGVENEISDCSPVTRN